MLPHFSWLGISLESMNFLLCYDWFVVKSINNVVIDNQDDDDDCRGLFSTKCDGAK